MQLFMSYVLALLMKIQNYTTEIAFIKSPETFLNNSEPPA